MRTASNDALVQRTLHPLKIPRKSSAGPSKAGSSSSTSADCSGVSPVVSRSQQQALTTPYSSSSSSQQGKKRRGTKGKAPFSGTSGGSGRSGGKRKGTEKSPDGVTPLLRVGGCLSAHCRHWQSIGASSWVLSVLQDGYRIPFLDSPPLSPCPVSFPMYQAGSPRSLALRQEVEKILSKDALEIVLDPGPGFYSRLFLVEKVMGGFVSSIAVIPGVGRRSPCDRDVRQLDGGGLRQQAGRDGLPFSLLVGQSASEVGGESRRPPRCQVSSRAVQCSGRSQPLGSGYRDRVVSPPSGGERPASPLGLAVDRSVRNEFQHQASPILFPCPGSPGSLRGCVSPSLGQPGSLRVSTLSSGRTGGGSSQRDPKSLHDSGCPPLAGEGVVRRPSLSTDPTTSGASVVGPVVVAAPLQQVPQLRPCAEPSRVAALQHLLRKSGFSRGSAVEMSSSVRTSTSRLYQAKWMLFCG